VKRDTPFTSCWAAADEGARPYRRAPGAARARSPPDPHHRVERGRARRRRVGGRDGIAKLRENRPQPQAQGRFRVAHADMAFKRMRAPALFRREPLEQLIARTVGTSRSNSSTPCRREYRRPQLGMQVFWGLQDWTTSASPMPSSPHARCRVFSRHTKSAAVSSSTAPSSPTCRSRRPARSDPSSSSPSTCQHPAC